MKQVEVYCKKNTTLYIYENEIKLIYFGNVLIEPIANNETIFETLARLFNTHKNINNFITIFNDVTIMLQDFEQKLRQKLIFDSFSVKVVDI